MQSYAEKFMVGLRRGPESDSVPGPAVRKTDAGLRAPPPSPEPRGGLRRSRGLHRREVLAIAGLWLLIVPVWCVSIYVRSRFGAQVSWPVALGLSFAEAATWGAACLAALSLARAFPPERGRRLAAVAVHGGIGVLVVVARSALILSLYQAANCQSCGQVPMPVRVGTKTVSDLVVYLIILSAAYGYEYFRRYREREISAMKLAHQLTTAQLQLLKVQLHPHFLFNTLHAISSLVHRDPDRAERMIASLSELLRTALAHQQTQEVSVGEEVESLEPYLDIEKTRLGDRLTVELRIDPDTREAAVPHLILQPLVENAVRHGIAPRRRPGRVEVSAARVDGELRLEVADNGCGITGPTRPGAIGLANTRARLEQLYGEAHRFQIDSAPEEGTRVEIRIPFRRAPGSAPVPTA